MQLKFLRPGEEVNVSHEETSQAGSDGLVYNEIVHAPDASHCSSVEQQRRNLPIYASRNSFLYAIQENRVTLITGETGSGKSTQLPQYLYETGWLDADEGCLAVTQPRRVAAITVAHRIAEEKNWRLGGKIGYSVRFDKCISSKTLIHFFTDGMLIQEMMRDPLLTKYRVIMLDEVHERSIQSDILLGLVKKILRRRPFDLRIIISSATLEAHNFVDYFSGMDFKTDEDTHCLKNLAHLTVQGRLYPVKIFYSNDPVPCYIKAALELIFHLHENKPPGGDILVFLTGQQEVTSLLRLVVEEYRKRKDDARHPQQRSAYQPLRVVPFYGSLSQSEQLRAFSKTTRACRKVTLATNLAEASVTLPGIVYVIDCGFSRIRAYNPETGLEALVTIPVSQASAQQRAGRAGRLRAGEAYRLYPENAYEELPRFTSPEILRSDLSCALLRLKSLGVDRLANFDWLEPKPPLEHIGRAAERLVALRVLEPASCRLTTPYGLRVAEVLSACGFSDPGAAVALLASAEENCTAEVAAVLCMMQLQHVFTNSEGRVRTDDHLRRQMFGCVEGDHLTMLNAFLAYGERAESEGAKRADAWCERMTLNAKGLAHARLLYERVRGVCKSLKIAWKSCRGRGQEDGHPVLRALVRGFFTQVARLRPGYDYYLTVRGDHALRVHQSSIFYSAQQKPPPFILFTRAFLAEEAQRGLGVNPTVSVGTCISEISSIEPKWLMQLVPHYFMFGTEREHVEYALTHQNVL